MMMRMLKNVCVVLRAPRGRYRQNVKDGMYKWKKSKQKQAR